MFDNIGGKIKTLAKVVCGIGMVISVALGLRAMERYASSDAVVYGLIIILVGCILSWISVFILYGFGELIEKTSSIERMMRMSQPNANPYNNMQYYNQQINPQNVNSQNNMNNGNSTQTWQCPRCGGVNMIFMSACQKCGNVRPDAVNQNANMGK